MTSRAGITPRVMSKVTPPQPSTTLDFSFKGNLSPFLPDMYIFDLCGATLVTFQDIIREFHDSDPWRTVC